MLQKNSGKEMKGGVLKKTIDAEGTLRKRGMGMRLEWRARGVIDNEMPPGTPRPGGNKVATKKETGTGKKKAGTGEGRRRLSNLGGQIEERRK